jgi:hypothetical protein
MITRLLSIVHCIMLIAVVPTYAQDFNTVRGDEILVMKSGDTSKGVDLMDKSSDLVRLLGKPDRIYDYYMKMDEVTAKVYQYGSSKFYFVNDLMEFYQIFDSRICVGAIGGKTFKIGDKLTISTKVIPQGSGKPTKQKKIITKSFRNFKVDIEPGNIEDIPYTSIMYAGIGKSDAYFDLFFGKDDSVVCILTSSP